VSIFLYLFTKKVADIILAFATWDRLKKKWLVFVSIKGSFRILAVPQRCHSILVPTSSKASAMSETEIHTLAVHNTSGAVHAG